MFGEDPPDVTPAGPYHYRLSTDPTARISTDPLKYGTRSRLIGVAESCDMTGRTNGTAPLRRPGG